MIILKNLIKLFNIFKEIDDEKQINSRKNKRN